MPVGIVWELKMSVYGSEWGEDLPKPWHVSSDDIVKVNGTSYVYLVPSSYSLAQVVTHGADGLPKPLPKNFSLTRCGGLDHLIELRNDAAWAAPPIACGLFARCQNVAEPKAKVPRRKLDSAATTVTITVPAFGDRASREIVVKRPVHPRDRLALPIEADVINHVLLYMRSAEFDCSDGFKKQSSVKGVWNNKQRNSCLVRFFDSAKNQTRIKTVRDQEAGIQLLASMCTDQASEGQVANDAGEGHDTGDASASRDTDSV